MSTAPLADAKDWNNYWSLDGSQRFTKISWSKRRILNILNAYIKPNGFALDAGCGSGFFSKFFCDAKMSTVALDYSTSALDIASKITEGRVKTQQADLLDEKTSTLFGNKFDIIFTDGLFEHFSSIDQDKILNNFKKLLSAGGKIVTFVPNRWSPWEIIRPLYMPGIDEKPFTMNQLLTMHTRNGLRIIKSGGINTIPFKFSPDQIAGRQFGMLLYVVVENVVSK